MIVLTGLIYKDMNFPIKRFFLKKEEKYLLVPLFEEDINERLLIKKLAKYFLLL